jgi:hypothetical protein
MDAANENVPPSGPPQAFDTVLVTAIVTAAVVPFVQALATKAAEDSYAAVRSALRRRFREARGADQPEGEPLLIIRNGNLTLYARPEMTDAAIGALASLDLAAITEAARTGQVQIFFNETTGRWQIDQR